VAFVWNEKPFASFMSFRFCLLELGAEKKKKKQCERRSQDIKNKNLKRVKVKIYKFLIIQEKNREKNIAWAGPLPDTPASAPDHYMQDTVLFML